MSAALELLALFSGPLSWLLFIAAREDAWSLVAFFAVGLGSGIGWIRAGRVGAGCAIAVVRAVAVPASAFALFYYSFAGVLCERQECRSPSVLVALLLLIGFLAAYFVIPVASALLLLADTSLRGTQQARR